MKWSDVLWEVLDNGLYLGSIVAGLVLMFSAIACPLLLLDIADDVAVIRAALQNAPACQCRPAERPRRGDGE